MQPSMKKKLEEKEERDGIILRQDGAQSKYVQPTEVRYISRDFT